MPETFRACSAPSPCIWGRHGEKSHFSTFALLFFAFLHFLHHLKKSFKSLGVKSKVAYFGHLKPIYGLTKFKTVAFKYFGHY